MNRLLALLVVVMLGLTPLTAAEKEVPDEELLSEAERILGEVEELRELPAKQEVEVRVTSREEVLKFLEQRLEEEQEALERLELQGRLWMRWGIYPRTERFVEEVKEVLVAQVGGYYDPARDTFFVADWIPLSLQATVMAHELTHALQDQYWDLEKLMKPVEGNNDAEMARSAVIEGDGTVVMLQHALAAQGLDVTAIPDLVAAIEMSMGAMEGSELAFPPDTPDVLMQALIFPYAYGGAFIKHAVQGRGWPDVARAYEDPPRSTEQILHPSKYWDEVDEPTAVTVDDVADRLGLSEPLLREVEGQFMIYIWLKQTLPREAAAQAATGWDGDQVALYGEAGDETLIMVSAWDSALEAAEFASAVARCLGQDTGDVPPEAFSSPLGAAWLGVQEAEVTLVLGDSNASPESLTGVLAPAPATQP